MNSQINTGIFSIKRKFFIVFFLCSSWSFIAIANEEFTSKQSNKFHLWLVANQTYESCIVITENKHLHYKFNSTQPLEFDIHYHENDKVHYSAPIKTYKFSKNVFTPTITRSYCMMWTNKNKKAVLLIHEHKIQSPSNKESEHNSNSTPESGR